MDTNGQVLIIFFIIIFLLQTFALFLNFVHLIKICHNFSIHPDLNNLYSNDSTNSSRILHKILDHSCVIT